MTTLQIDSNDKNVIAEIKSFVMQKLHVKVQIINDVEPQRKTKSLSNTLDQQIKNTEFTNTAKANKIKEAMEGLNAMLDTQTKNLSPEEAKEQYFTSKANS